MSYEGYKLILCKKGHAAYEDCYSFFEQETWVCKHCNTGVGFVYGVDQTNCNGHEIKLKVLKKAKIKKCPTCGHLEIAEQAVYKKPTKKEIKEFEKKIKCSNCGMGR